MGARRLAAITPPKKRPAPATPTSARERRASDVLLRYQREALEVLEAEDVVVYEKSRRIGVTWAVGAWATLKASSARSAGGMSVYYIGFNLEMAREFVDVCADWARAFSVAATQVNEYLFEEGDADGGIKALRIGPFASGFEIIALSSRPRSLRGRQGAVILDEAAFHDELEEMLKSALALLMWGGKLLVVSTHDGAENPFAALVDDCRAGRRKYKLLRTTLDDALADGLYKRIAEKEGKPWSPEAEAAWVERLRDYYGDGAGEELDVIPRRSGGKYIARTLLEARADADAPALRWSCTDDFVRASEEARTNAAREFFAGQVLPLVAKMPPDLRSYVGEDFGRSGDLSVQWPLQVDASLRRRTPFIVELRNVPFQQQQQILHWLCDALPRFSGIALDARGNGQSLAEFTSQRYGESFVAQVMLSEGWYREHAPPMKAAIEDDAFSLPKDSEVIDDFRALEVVNGVARVVERTTGGTGKRHGDAAIAAMLAHFASRTLEPAELFAVASSNHVTREGFAGERATFRNLAGWTRP